MGSGFWKLGSVALATVSFIHFERLVVFRGGGGGFSYAPPVAKATDPWATDSVSSF